MSIMIFGDAKELMRKLDVNGDKYRRQAGKWKTCECCGQRPALKVELGQENGWVVDIPGEELDLNGYEFDLAEDCGFHGSKGLMCPASLLPADVMEEIEQEGQEFEGLSCIKIHHKYGIIFRGPVNPNERKPEVSKREKSGYGSTYNDTQDVLWVKGLGEIVG